MYPYHDAYPPPVKPVRAPATAPCVQLELPEYQFAELKRLCNLPAAADATNGRPVDSQATTAPIVSSSNEDGRSATVCNGTTPPRKVMSPPVRPTERCDPAV
eukprot:3107862-Pleurochrysis_carterae.AAC.1